jgi:predicted nucleic acid-binding protein
MPSPERPVVVDSTPIIARAGRGQLGLQQGVDGEVLVPPAVWTELTRGQRRPGGREDLAAAPWIQSARLADPRQPELFSDLDRGEAEVLALARQTKARLVIIDDRLGRRHATRLGLKLTGTFGVLLAAKQKGLLSEITSLVDLLAENRLYASPALLALVLAKAGEA